MQINAPAIRKGMILEVDHNLWRVMKIQHVTPGKGVACMQVEMRSIESGNKTNKRFNSTERVEQVTLSQRNMQYLYEDSGKFHFMDMESYEQIELDHDFVEDILPYLLPETTVIVESHDLRPLNVRLPVTVVLEVVECDPVIKGQTATGSFKPAKLETGASLMVPQYLESGTKVRVNTETGEFMERA